MLIAGGRLEPDHAQVLQVDRDRVLLGDRYRHLVQRDRRQEVVHGLGVEGDRHIGLGRGNDEGCEQK